MLQLDWACPSMVLISMYPEPSGAAWLPRIHRAVNKGSEPYEEIVTFFRENSSIDPQPVRS